MRTRPPRPRKTYDRHWAYPNPAGPVRRLLGDSKAGRDLCRRIAGGDPVRVLDWMRRHEGPFELFNVLQLGLGGAPPGPNWFLRFDEVPVATQLAADGGGPAATLYARRTGRAVLYRAWRHGPREWAGGFARPWPLTRAEVRRLFRDPPWRDGPVESGAGLVFHDPGPTPWDPAAWPTRLGGWDGDVPAGPDGHAPCPACGSDLNAGDTCAHLMSTWTMAEGNGHWAGKDETLEDLRDAYTELDEAVGWMSKTRRASFLREVLPPELRRALGRGPDDGGVSELQDYLDARIGDSPTSLGGYEMELHDDHAWEGWTVSWDTMARTRARDLDGRFAADARALRRAANRADRLELAQPGRVRAGSPSPAGSSAPLRSVRDGEPRKTPATGL